MAGSEDQNQVHHKNASDAAQKAANAVQTPPPQSGSSQPFDSEAPTILHPQSGFDAPTLIEVDSSEAPTLVDSPGARAPSRPASKVPVSNWTSALLLPIGSVLANRYEILQMLGEGGMGAVYKARDNELDRIIALKVIRPELASNPEILQRFKQELVLARQVTDRNIIRIFDLGEADGMRFITMEYVEGTSLYQILRERGKLNVQESAEIIVQVLTGLKAAHLEGVIHRDLKPGNIMRDQQGRILVMDFGLARSLESDGMTKTGAVLGTMEYMSPEQAMGGNIDQRSDLFTVGLIFFELLTGKMPFKAETALASLLKRVNERAVSLSSLDSAIPVPIEKIVAKCLERDPNLRYQTAQEFIDELKKWEGEGAAASLHFPPVRTWGQDIRWHWIGASAAVLVLAVAGFFLRAKLFGPSSNQSVAGPSVSFAVVPFRNASGDPNLDWISRSLAEMLNTDVGQSARVHTISAEHMQQILRDLRIAPETTLDEATLQRLAEFSNADHLLWGQYARYGDQLRIDATLRDLKHDRSVPLKIEGIAEKDLPKAVDQLAHSVQENLNLPSNVVEEMRKAAFKPSSQSVTALRSYSDGLDLERKGNYLDAQKRFEDATKEDPQFALAYSKLGVTYASLGYDDKAADFSRKAVDLSSQLPVQERYRILADQALVLKDNKKALDSFENLAKVFPDDVGIRLTLSQLYGQAGQYDKARDYLTKILAQDPKNPQALLILGSVEIQSGNSQGSLDYLNRALSLAIQLENPSVKGTALYLLGVTYRNLSKWDDALRNDQESLAVRRELGDKRGIASCLAEMARIQEEVGKRDVAFKNYEEALRLRREIGDKAGTADVLIDVGNFYHTSGRYDEALKFYKETLQLERQMGNPLAEANALGNVASTYVDKGQYEDALTYFQQALQIREKLNIPADIGETEQNIGYVYSMMGQFDDATTYYLRALEIARNGEDKENLAIYSHNLGTVFEYQGRYGAALKAKQDALKTLRDIHEQGYWLAAILSSYGNELSLVGRFDDAQKALDEALREARKVGNNAMISQTLNYQGDRLFYLGDTQGARALYQQASQISAKASDNSTRLLAAINLAKLELREGRPGPATNALKAAVQKSESGASKYTLLECSIYLGQALLNEKKPSQAQSQLEDAMRQSEKLGIRPLLVKSHYALAKVLSSTNQNEEASRHLEQARQTLEEMRKDAGSDALLKRSDFNPIVAQSGR